MPVYILVKHAHAVKQDSDGCRNRVGDGLQISEKSVTKNIPAGKSSGSGAGREVDIRPANRADIPGVIDLDYQVTTLAKPEYWDDMFDRYGDRDGRFFLVAQDRGGGALLGFIIGEVRAWEFGSPPCGWIFAIGVDPGARLSKIGSMLFDAMCERLRAAGASIRCARCWPAKTNSI